VLVESGEEIAQRLVAEDGKEARQLLRIEVLEEDERVFVDELSGQRTRSDGVAVGDGRVQTVDQGQRRRRPLAGSGLHTRSGRRLETQKPATGTCPGGGRRARGARLAGGPTE
jgi:hypothetical protein